jgi:3-carboxymuconate cyclase
MKKYLFIALTLFVFSTQALPQKTKLNNKLTMLVGTYTNGTSKGIYTYQFDQTNGQALILDSIAIENPSYLTLSANEKFVYAVSEMPDSTAAVIAYGFNKQNGKLKFLNRRLTKGADPCYVSTNGKIVLTANYTGGCMSAFTLKQDGSLNTLSTLYRGSTGGPDAIRQATPHIHCAAFSPDGKYIFATDFSADRILHFTVNPKQTIPNALKETTNIDGDSGPRHLTFSPNGKYAYLISELSGNITVFNYRNGKLTKVQVITADKLHARGSADIHLSPDGKFLYASNRLKGDGIAIFKVDLTKGTLTDIGYQFTGIHPRNFNITPNGKYLLVACRDSNFIQVYQRNETTGLLNDTHQSIYLSKPVCIKFAE